MFLRNNERIDTEILRNRVAHEIGELKRQPMDGPAPPLGYAVPAIQRTSPELETEGKLVPAYVQRFRKVLTWLWCFVHLPRIYTALESTKSRLASHEQEVEKHQADLEYRTASRLDQLEQRVIDLEQSVVGPHGLELRVTSLKREIMFQQRRLTRLGEGTVAATPAGSDTTDHRLDSLYVAFEEVFRGARQDIKGRMRPYVDQLVLCGAGQPGKPIIDIGCGRGEWLELLKENHLEAYGIDSNLMMIEHARSLGLDAQEADLLAHLRGLADASRSAVTAFHVVEHLEFGVLIDFLDEALRVLMPGGMLILETPNPENLRVGANSFYNDPTHRNPIPPEPLRFLVDQRGFAAAEILRLHPFPLEQHLKLNNADTRRLNEFLFGPQDYAVIARRP